MSAEAVSGSGVESPAAGAAECKNMEFMGQCPGEPSRTTYPPGILLARQDGGKRRVLIPIACVSS
jgi:hypothetical protein